jgi:hypothetical protein
MDEILQRDILEEDHNLDKGKLSHSAVRGHRKLQG